jgi:hypothetical protein
MCWSLESGAISLPAATDSIRWPGFNLDNLFLPAN